MDFATKMEVPQERIEKFLMAVLQNLPEASMGIHCHGWDYEGCDFDFIDEDDDDKKYNLKMPDFVRGFEILMKKALQPSSEPGGFYADGWAPTDVFKEDWDDWEGDWDGCVVDGLVQCAALGDVVYG